VKRVVLTSSVASIYGDASDTYKAPNGVLTEDCINMASSLGYQPYSYSKLMAEMAAWQIAGSQTQWSMVTINPSLVMGPGLKCHATSVCNKLVVQIGGGELAAAISKTASGIVDVRDVAYAHIAAAYQEGVTGRFVVSGHHTDFVQLTDASAGVEIKSFFVFNTQQHVPNSHFYHCFFITDPSRQVFRLSTSGPRSTKKTCSGWLRRSYPE
jgi:nucleoside-diphosphate-sugar epimerase